jgi:hypothetical protein
MYLNLRSLLDLQKMLGTGRSRWVSIGSLPFSRTYVYDLLNKGLIESAVVRLPGSRRSRRLIDSESLNRWIEGQVQAQKNENRQEASVS